jgi:hypothetical protein
MQNDHSAETDGQIPPNTENNGQNSNTENTGQITSARNGVDVMNADELFERANALYVRRKQSESVWADSTQTLWTCMRMVPRWAMFDARLATGMYACVHVCMYVCLYVVRGCVHLCTLLHA